MLDASTSDTSKGSPGRITRRISTKSREPNMQKVARASSWRLHFKVHSLSSL